MRRPSKVSFVGFYVASLCAVMTTRCEAGTLYTYTYTGASFNWFTGDEFSQANSISLSFRLPFLLPPNLSITVSNSTSLMPFIKDWTIGDGIHTVSAADDGNGPFLWPVDLATDSQGNLINWYFVTNFSDPDSNFTGEMSTSGDVNYESGSMSHEYDESNNSSYSEVGSVMLEGPPNLSVMEQLSIGWQEGYPQSTGCCDWVPASPGFWTVTSSRSDVPEAPPEILLMSGLLLTQSKYCCCKARNKRCTRSVRRRG